MDRGRTTFERGGIRGLVCLAPLFFCLLEVACTDTAAGPKAVEVAPLTLTIGLPVQTGEDPLHGAIQAARFLSFEGLAKLNRDGRPQPKLAESWTQSTDGLTWTIKLRPNTVFHDGSVVDSSAVKNSLERSLATTDIDQYPGLADITGIEAPSPLEVVIHLRARSTFLLDDLGVSILKSQPGSTPVGTGPYVTTSISNNELVMTAFPKYYRGAPKIQRVVWKAYPAVRAAWAAMMRGDIDFLYEVGPEAVEFMQGDASVSAFPFLRSYLFGILLNSERQEFKDWRVRRALNYAIKRTDIVDQALKGHGIAADSAAWPQHWAYDHQIAGYLYDPSRTVALLDAAGIPAKEKVADPSRPPGRLHFSCLVPDGFALWERMGLIAQRSLSEVGIDMQLESVAFETFNQRIANHQFEAVLTEFVAGNSPSRPFTFWHSASKINTWGYKNPYMDDALDGIRRAANDSDYREAFHRFQVESINSPPAIFLALGETTRAVSKRFQVIAPAGSDILPTIADWRLANDSSGTTN